MHGQSLHCIMGRHCGLSIKTRERDMTLSEICVKFAFNKWYKYQFTIMIQSDKVEKKLAKHFLIQNHFWILQEYHCYNWLIRLDRVTKSKGPKYDKKRNIYKDAMLFASEFLTTPKGSTHTKASTHAQIMWPNGKIGIGAMYRNTR